MNGFTYTLLLLEPVLANSLSGDPNTARSLSFLPGAVMRGAVIQSYLKKNNLRELDILDDKTRCLFFSDQTRYLHAYPADNQKWGRALPVPLSWRKLKNPAWDESDNKRRIFDLSVEDHFEQLKGEQLKALEPEAFWALSDKTAYWIERRDQVNIHTQRDAIKGKATTEHGAVFRYESLSAGMRLVGVVLTQSEQNADDIKELMLGRTFLLGKSRTAGYGLAKIEEVNPSGDPAIAPVIDDWREVAGLIYEDQPEVDSDAHQTKSHQNFTLTMLSDAIIRDNNGQYTLDPIPAIRKQMGLSDTPTLEAERVFRKAEVIGGFNRKWGLPLPQVAAIAAGSVFVIQANPSIEDALLRRLEIEGIGERRLEGMGRVAINLNAHTPDWWIKDEIEADKKDTVASQAIALRADEQRMAQQILTRLMRRDLDMLLLDAVGGLQIIGKVPNNQLSRWRAIARNAMAEDSPVKRIGRMAQFISSEKQKKSRAWENMNRARVDQGGERVRLTDWIDEVLTHERSPWNWFRGYDTKDPAPLKLGSEVEIGVSEELAVEYRIRLIDGVLARAAKDRSES